MKKILGMGNAVLDIVAPVSDKFLELTNMDKGSMTLVDQETSDNVLTRISPIKKDSGGSVANSMVGISLLGLESQFCGKVKNDQLGNEFVSDMKKTNTKFLCKQSSDGLPTARCIVFVTPDGERSMQTFLGASTTLGQEDIDPSFFNEIDYLLIEGYLWSSKTAREAINKALEIAESKNIKVIFSLSDSNLVKMFRSDFIKLIKSNINILIGNENEISELLEHEDQSKFQNDQKIDILVKTLGQKGAQVSYSNKSEIVSSYKVNSVVDTTGAGDMFAAGFLFKLLQGQNPSESALFGCKVASLIIQQYGARLSKDLLKDLF